MTIKIQYHSHGETQKILFTKLRTFNIKNCQWIRDHKPHEPNKVETLYHNFVALADDKTIGGAVGFIEYNWYFLDLLYIEEAFRGQHVGSSLLAQIEKYAKKTRAFRNPNRNLGFSRKGVLREKRVYAIRRIKRLSSRNHLLFSQEKFTRFILIRRKDRCGFVRMADRTHCQGGHMANVATGNLQPDV